MHPVKVHIWAGISMRGWMGICIFEGIMNAAIYVKILKQTLIPFIEEVYLDSHRFMQLFLFNSVRPYMNT